MYLHRIRHDRDWWSHLLNVEARKSLATEGWDERVAAYLWTALALAPGKRVLDLACGDGEVTRRLARMGAQGVGLEICPQLVQHCAGHAHPVARFRYLEGDMRNPGAALARQAPFDAAFLIGPRFGVFEDVVNQVVLAKAGELLAPGGRLLVQVHGPAALERGIGRHWYDLDGGIMLLHVYPKQTTRTRVTAYRYLDARGVLHSCEEEEHLRVYDVGEMAVILDKTGFREAAIGAASFRLPNQPFDEARDLSFVVVARKA